MYQLFKILNFYTFDKRVYVLTHPNDLGLLKLVNSLSPFRKIHWRALFSA